MAKSRLITSDIFNDDWFGPLTHFQQILWIGLFAKCADDQGRLQDNPVVIRATVFPYQDVDLDQIELALEKFAEAGRVYRYRVNGKCLLQIVHWWDHQQQQWASPSKFPPPPLWEDHVRTRENGEYRQVNWYHKSGNADKHRDYLIQVNGSGERAPRAQVGGHAPVPVPVPIPVSKRVLPDANDFEPPEPEQAAMPPGATPPPAGTKPAKKAREPKPPDPPGVQVFKHLTGRNPAKCYYEDIELKVGSKTEDTTFWAQVVKAWIGIGRNPANVNGMLEHFERREIPTTKPNGGNGHGFSQRPTGTVDPDKAARTQRRLEAVRRRAATEHSDCPS